MTASGRGAQVILSGAAQAAARGTAANSYVGNRKAMDDLILAGAVADGNTEDGSTLTGVVPDWAPGTALAPSLVLAFADDGVLDSRITYTGGGGTYFNAAGALTAATTNVARFDTDPVTLAARGLLIEGARTNLLLNSATLSTQSVTVAAVAHTLSFYGTGTVTLTGTSTAGPLTGTGAFPARVSLTFTPTAGTLTCTVTGSVLNAQIEAGAFATSWITTAGASAIRAADVATMPIGSWYNATVGTLAVSAMLPSVADSTQHEIAGFTDGTTANSWHLRNQATSTIFRTLAFSGNVSAGSVDGGATLAAGAVFNGVGTYNFSTLAIGSDLAGAVATSGTITAAPIGITTLVFGLVRQATTNGYVRRLRYWPRALSAAELQAMTV